MLNNILNNIIVKHALKTALVMIIFAFVGTLILAYTANITKAPIEKSERQAKLDLFRDIVPDNMHDNDLLKDSITVPADALLGVDAPQEVHRARLAGKPSALIMEAIAPDGYSGNIKLLIGVKADGSLAGVRVSLHKETPGLGDYIDIKHGNWIKGFDGQSLATQTATDWQVKKDGGKFDYMAGATISPRAVVKAVHKALQYVANNKEMLFK